MPCCNASALPCALRSHCTLRFRVQAHPLAVGRVLLPPPQFTNPHQWRIGIFLLICWLWDYKILLKFSGNFLMLWIFPFSPRECMSICLSKFSLVFTHFHSLSLYNNIFFIWHWSKYLVDLQVEFFGFL